MVVVVAFSMHRRLICMNLRKQSKSIPFPSNHNGNGNGASVASLEACHFDYLPSFLA